MKRIHKVAVLGAGTMGARIAAHFANAGVPSLLLDIVLQTFLRTRTAPRAIKSRPPDSTAPENRSPLRFSKRRFRGSSPWGISTTT